jgi:hypothetical protein
MAKWTVPPVPENARVRRVITREYVRRNSDTETRYKVKIKPRDPVLLRRSTHHTELFINGVRLKVVTRQQLAKFLDVSYNTIQTWYKQGVFGEPFLMDKDPQGFDRPYWLVSQMVCFIRVLNEILRQGYLAIQWSRFEEQVLAIHDGFDRHAKMMSKRLDKNEELGNTTSRFGVELLD